MTVVVDGAFCSECANKNWQLAQLTREILELRRQLGAAQNQVEVETILRTQWRLRALHAENIVSAPVDVPMFDEPVPRADPDASTKRKPGR